MFINTAICKEVARTTLLPVHTVTYSVQSGGEPSKVNDINDTDNMSGVSGVEINCHKASVHKANLDTEIDSYMAST